MTAFRSRHTDLGWELRGQEWAPVTRLPRPPRGPRSLAVMALEHVAHCIAQLGPEHVRGLSVQSAERLRLLLSSRGELSLHAWKLLSRYLADPAYNGDASGPARWRYHIACPHPQSPLRVFAGPLSCSPTTDFIAHLRITAPPGSAIYGADELLVLATLPNLGVLEIVEDFHLGLDCDMVPAGLDPCQVSDRLVKGWSLHPDPFPALRVLRLWGCYDGLTPACLTFATCLPALTVLDVSVGNYDAASWRDASATAAGLGWKCLAPSRRSLPQESQESHELERMLYEEAAPGSAASNAKPRGEQDDDKARAAASWAFQLYSYLTTQACTEKSDGHSRLSAQPFASLSLGQDRAPRHRSDTQTHRLIFSRAPTSISFRKPNVASAPAARKRSGSPGLPRLRAKRSRAANIRDMLASLSGG